MAEHVIAADPFGVLRYGETAKLTSVQAKRMFDSLCSLADVDPLFRAQDWDSHTCAGLMNPALRGNIDAIIGSTESNEHLRSLLLQVDKCVDHSVVFEAFIHLQRITFGKFDLLPPPS